MLSLITDLYNDNIKVPFKYKMGFVYYLGIILSFDLPTNALPFEYFLSSFWKCIQYASLHKVCNICDKDEHMIYQIKPKMLNKSLYLMT